MIIALSKRKGVIEVECDMSLVCNHRQVIIEIIDDVEIGLSTGPAK